MSYFLLVVQQLVCPFAAAESPMPSSHFYSLGQETNAITSSNLALFCPYVGSTPAGSVATHAGWHEIIIAANAGLKLSCLQV
ncbi:hypothetical protein AVDCRST_MAG94-2529 [uncultured Leptolyngbya sp.]|uniref:Uncharacterized protein n=1 Tax=uncultured Leptolyngbya sp. TaxID=332963 RepID=A0A6J4M4G9_9CYAN|nr:hypothetical protein AVDCRST_MAG94-2529 [uncultured Leptolyngbya sp.]